MTTEPRTEAGRALADGLDDCESGHPTGRSRIRAIEDEAARKERERTLTVDAMRAALHEQGIGCKPNTIYCRATHRGHAERLVRSLAAITDEGAS